MLRILRAALRRTGYDVVRVRSEELPPDLEPEIRDTWHRVRPYTITSPARIHTLCKAVEYVVARDVPGAIVECGVWRGGSMMAVADTLRRLGRRDRDLYLYDTFEGMTAPDGKDVSAEGLQATEEFRVRGDDWCRAGIEDVRANLASIEGDPARVHLVKGRVEDTVPGTAPEQIALLRLDTDWYASTRHELEHLYPRLSPGGVLIIDDYGYWKGARQAVDEYLGRNGLKLLLIRVDHTARMAVKP